MNLRLIDFFSTKSTSTKLRMNTLPEWQIFLYFYVIMVFDALNFTLGWINSADEKLTTSNLIFIWGYFLFTAIGLLVLFTSNGGFKGRNFVIKFFSFSVTVGFKYVIISEIVARLPKFIPLLIIPHYGLVTWWIINIVMLLNIAYRIRETC